MKARYAAMVLMAIMIGLCIADDAWSAMAGDPARRELVIAEGMRSETTVVVSPDAGNWEAKAAADLVRCIKLMTGADVALANTPEAIAAALKSKAPAFIIGSEALKADKGLQKKLDKVKKQNPYLRADAIVNVRDGNRVYLAGTNDDSHYYAVAYLLRLWGCRWYIPTEIGECIPEEPRLTIGDLDVAYAPPFEVRGYWISWVGDQAGRSDFERRNYMNNESVPSGHALSQYTRDLVPAGGSHWNVPVAEDATAEHVAAKIEARFAAGERISLGMEDGTYTSNSPVDKELLGNIDDKYFLVPSLTDPFMVFYNKVCKILLEKHPNSTGKIGFLSYANITLPPQRDIVAAKPLVAYLAPIDIDPIHGMDDEVSPPRREYREMLYRWSKVMEGRVVIYDYDQGMLVWRSIPNPSIQGIRQDMKHYRDAGILGISTESRNAIATTFLNLHVRGQLMWNPDADVDALLDEFYVKFYGPVAEPMSKYWGGIFKAWADTVCTEHEFFIAPAIYTPELMKELRTHLVTAETAVNPIAAKAGRTRNEQLVPDRVKFARLGFNVLDQYMTMIFKGAGECDYKAAHEAGQQGLVARDLLTDMNGTFTTYRNYGDKGPAWFPGEVNYYGALRSLTDGTTGTLIEKLPVEWAFHRDASDAGLPLGWAYRPANMTYWENHRDEYNVMNRKDYPITEWEMARTDLYLEGQGIKQPDWQALTGYMWYKTIVDLDRAQAARKVHINFPGLFSECWLYVNGQLVQHRPQNYMWWRNSYLFQWDVDISKYLKPGDNDISLRVYTKHHLAGMFRRPFLYEPVPKPE